MSAIKLRRHTVERGLIPLATDIPQEWNLEEDGGQYYGLNLRMSRIETLQRDFQWRPESFSSRAEFSSLPDSTRILTLDLSLNDLVSLEHDQLVPFSQLRILNASLNRIQRFPGIEVLRRLVSLDLSHNHIDRLSSVLACCRHLVKLNLSVNQIENISLMPVMSNLRVLDLHRNRLKSLSGVQLLPMLQELYARNNRLTDIVPVSACLRLTTLDCSGNRIASLQSVTQTLTGLLYLKIVSLFDNPIASDLQYRPALVNNTSLVVLDNVVIRSVPINPDVDTNFAYHWGTRHQLQSKPTNQVTFRHDVRHDVMPVVDVAKKAFHDHLQEERQRLKESKLKLQQKADLYLEAEYQAYEEKTARDLDACMRYLKTLPYNSPHQFTYGYFKKALERHSSSQLHGGDDFKWASSNKYKLQLPAINESKQNYRNIRDTPEILRNVYKELVPLSHRTEFERQQEVHPWDL